MANFQFPFRSKNFTRQNLTPLNAAKQLLANMFFGAPTLLFETGAATGITSSSAVVHVIVTDLGGHTSLSLTVDYGFDTTYSEGTKIVAITITEPGDYYATINNLSPNTLYHCRAVADDGTTFYGSDVMCTTAPLITTIPIHFNIDNSIKTASRGQVNIDNTITKLLKGQINIDGTIATIWIGE